MKSAEVYFAIIESVIKWRSTFFVVDQLTWFFFQSTANTMLYKFKTLAQTLLTLKSNFWLENWILTFLGYGKYHVFFVLEELSSCSFFQSIALSVLYNILSNEKLIRTLFNVLNYYFFQKNLRFRDFSFFQLVWRELGTTYRSALRGHDFSAIGQHIPWVTVFHGKTHWPARTFSERLAPDLHLQCKCSINRP